MNIIHMLAQTAYNLLAPPRCVSCDVYLAAPTIVCNSCDEKIEPIGSTTVMVTATRPMHVYALSLYKEPLKTLIMGKSFGNRCSARQLGQLMAERLGLEEAAYDVIVPVPLHWTRRAWRGYNQARVMADELGSALSIPVEELVMRTQRTPFQSTLSRDARQQNVKAVFACSDAAKKYRNARILLVDDLMTTGATLSEVAKALYRDRAHAPARIDAAVGCRT